MHLSSIAELQAEFGLTRTQVQHLVKTQPIPTRLVRQPRGRPGLRIAYDYFTSALTVAKANGLIRQSYVRTKATAHVR
jgi:hypothetical protein